MDNKLEMKNVAEDMVDLYLDDCIVKSNMCLCERCRADVRAFALNNFPPHYVVTAFGDLLTRAMSLSNQYQADIITSIMKGIVRVKDSPRCAKEKEKAAANPVPEPLPAPSIGEEYINGRIDESEILDISKEFRA